MGESKIYFISISQNISITFIKINFNFKKCISLFFYFIILSFFILTSFTLKIFQIYFVSLVEIQMQIQFNLL